MTGRSPVSRRWVGAALGLLLLTGCNTGEPDEPQPTSPPTSSPTSSPAGVNISVSADTPGAVHVTATGLGGALDLEVAQCDRDATAGTSGIDHCDLTGAARIISNDDGSLDVDLPVWPAIGVGKRAEVLCDTGACTVGIVDVKEFQLLGVTQLPTDTQLPALTAAPSLQFSGLAYDLNANTGVVDVTGSGYPPNSTIALAQCPISGVSAVAAEDCLYGYGVSVDTDATGGFITRMSVFPTFQRSSGELVQCAGKAGVCAVASPWPNDPTIERMAIADLGGQ